MEGLKFPEGRIPQNRPEKLSMDEHLEFALFNWKNFPRKNDRDTSVRVSFVIRDDEEKYSPGAK